MKANEPIAAIASPQGVGAIAVIRISGEGTLALGDRVLEKPISKQSSNSISVNKIVDGSRVLDVVMAVSYRAPNSYTGEDMIEIFCHGGEYLPSRILELLIARGARMARPGEFTMRGVLNNKLDLIQAEAILDLVEAKSSQVLNAAIRNLSGEFSRVVAGVSRDIVNILVQVEGNLDFSGDEEWEVIEGLKRRIEAVSERINEIIETGREGIILREGPIIILSGRKNVGKSTLFNKILRIDRAIVTPIPGTTRDYLMEDLRIGHSFFRLVDTAGLGSPQDRVEEEGMRRAEGFLESARLVLLVLDRSRPLLEEDLFHLKRTEAKDKIIVLNKSDLPRKIDFAGDIEVSAKTGEGIEELKDLILMRLSKPEATEQMILRERHINCLISAKNYLESAINQDYLETISADLRRSLDSLGELTGRVTNEDLLNKIFSQFCIGK
ncbi:MAG TPA: tRNA uridine-5-carboxymethylaminomethyl(34) synthesis GTPase MnmE [bacterium (Candidatus Stahlbacteria)]|nr:tRNA uridine-5-carboxymethylaminomethyl(34) synthesis GTPase MnmE [Candidatus Stahlbacteria bacterium]